MQEGMDIRWQEFLFTKFSESSFVFETVGAVVTDSLEELALNLRKSKMQLYILWTNIRSWTSIWSYIPQPFFWGGWLVNVGWGGGKSGGAIGRARAQLIDGSSDCVHVACSNVLELKLGVREFGNWWLGATGSLIKRPYMSHTWRLGGINPKNFKQRSSCRIRSACQLNLRSSWKTEKTLLVTLSSLEGGCLPASLLPRRRYPLPAPSSCTHIAQWSSQKSSSSSIIHANLNLSCLLPLRPAPRHPHFSRHIARLGPSWPAISLPQAEKGKPCRLQSLLKIQL